MASASLPEAWADALGRVLAKTRDEWRRERELAQAESRQTIAELRREVVELKLALHDLQAADHERVNERIAAVKDGAPGIPGAPGKDGKDGAEGRRGKFAAPRAWSEGAVHYEGDLVFLSGSTWCARRDTAKKPPHEDWAPVAQGGADAPVGEVRGLFDEAQTYRRFDLVAFNGSEWRARCDDPGPLPGDGWALSAKQGKRGDKGERGDRGEPGRQGPAGPSVIERRIDGFRLVDTMSDGTTVVCDIRPAFELYDGEVR
jgi:hypothetical protein